MLNISCTHAWHLPKTKTHLIKPLKAPSSSFTRPWLRAKMAKKDMEAIKGLDLERYMGRWYEMASLPSRIEPINGTNSRATYTLREDGTVHVLNETWSDGKKGYIGGIACRVDNGSDEARFKVKFSVPPFLPVFPVYGDYWVLEVGKDYEHALVGEPSRKHLWILCRHTYLDEKIYNQLVEKAREEAYDVTKLHKIMHADPPPDEEGPIDSIGIWWVKCMFRKINK